MKVTKLGHCCLVLEMNGVRMITDPGIFSTGQEDIEGVDAVLITHEHADHYHLDSLKAILAKNPGCIVITNKGVGKLLAEAGIAFTQVGDGEETAIKGLPISGHGTEHGKIWGELPNVENTGFYIGDAFYFLGDGFFNPGLDVKVLALPTAGPWMKMPEALQFARDMNPKSVFPIHDGFFDKRFGGVFSKWPQDVLGQFGIDFTPLGAGDAKEF